MPPPEYPPEPYQPTYKDAIEVPALVLIQHHFYVKGFIGMTNQDVDDITNTTIQNGNFQIEQHGFDALPPVGDGFGWIVNEQLCVDGTIEYRGGANFRGLNTYVDAGCGPGV